MTLVVGLATLALLGGRAAVLRPTPELALAGSHCERPRTRRSSPRRRPIRPRLFVVRAGREIGLVKAASCRGAVHDRPPARPLTPGASAGSSRWPSRPTTRRAASSTSTTRGPPTARSRWTSSSATRYPDNGDPNTRRRCSRSFPTFATTTAASSSSGPTACSTSERATAAAAATRSVRPEPPGPSREDPAHRPAQGGAAPYTVPANNPFVGQPPASPRSGPTASAIRGASRSTA